MKGLETTVINEKLKLSINETETQKQSILVAPVRAISFPPPPQRNPHNHRKVDTIQNDQDFFPLSVAHFWRLTKQDLVLVTHKYSVQDEFGNCSMREISQCSVFADIPEKLKSFHMNKWLVDQIS